MPRCLELAAAYERKQLMNFELMASMMCDDYGHLENEVRHLEEGG